MSDYKTFDLSSLCNEKLETILAPFEKEDERLNTNEIEWKGHTFGNSKSEIVETLYGRYLNVLVAPIRKSELTEMVNFYIENSDGDKEKAIENFRLNKVSEPYVVNMILNFKKYP